MVFKGPQGRFLQSMALQDSKENRKQLILRSREILTTLLTLLPSNYISEILGPYYTVILNTIAQESASIRLSGEAILSDNFYKFIRPEFLWRNLGYLIHGQNTDFAVPTSFSDKKYREFLLGILASLLAGSTPKSIENGAKIFTENDVKIVELFLQSIERVKNSEIDISDQFTWRLDVAVEDTFDGRQSNLVEIQQGLEFFAEIIRPAHTLFDIRFILAENLRIGQEGCQDLLSENGFFQAATILVNPAITQTIKQGINNNRVTGIIETIVDDFIFVAGVPIKVLYTTEIFDIYNTSLRLRNLKVGMGVDIEGLIIDPLINLGFAVKRKNTETEICDSENFQHFEYSYDDARKCCDALRKIIDINAEVAFNPQVLGNNIFRTKFAPLVKPESSPVVLTDSPEDVQVLVNGFAVPVDTIIPLEGTIVLTNAPPADAIIQISYSYFPNPVVPLTTNTPGSVLNGWGPYLIHSVIAPEQVASGVYIPPAIGIRHRSYLMDFENQAIDQIMCDQKTLKYSWEGFEKIYSALTNSVTTLRLNTFEDNNSNYHKLNSYHILTNLGPKGTKIGGINPDFNDWTPRPDLETILNFPTPSMILTLKMRGRGDNLTFVEEDTLNSKSEINEDFDLNSSSIVVEETPLKNQYSLEVTVEESGTEDLLSIACDNEDFALTFGGNEFEEDYQLPAELENQGFLILNFFPIKAIAASPVQSFELDITEQEKHSPNKGLIGFNFTQSKNGSDVVIQTTEKFTEKLDFKKPDIFISSDFDIYIDNFLAPSNNFLILNNFQTLEQIIGAEEDELAFVPPNPGYLNDFVQNDEESELNEEADVVGTIPAPTEFVLVAANSQTLNDFNVELITYNSAGGGYLDELVLVEMDGGNPWTSITKITEELE